MINSTKLLTLKSYMDSKEEVPLGNRIKLITQSGDPLRVFQNGSAKLLAQIGKGSLNPSAGLQSYEEDVASEVQKIYVDHKIFFDEYVKEGSAHIEAMISELHLPALQKQAVNQVKVTLTKLGNRDYASSIYEEGDEELEEGEVDQIDL